MFSSNLNRSSLRKPAFLLPKPASSYIQNQFLTMDNQPNGNGNNENNGNGNNGNNQNKCALILSRLVIFLSVLGIFVFLAVSVIFSVRDLDGAPKHGVFKPRDKRLTTIGLLGALGIIAGTTFAIRPDWFVAVMNFLGGRFRPNRKCLRETARVMFILAFMIFGAFTLRYDAVGGIDIKSKSSGSGSSILSKSLSTASASLLSLLSTLTILQKVNHNDQRYISLKLVSVFCIFDVVSVFTTSRKVYAIFVPHLLGATFVLLMSIACKVTERVIPRQLTTEELVLQAKVDELKLELDAANASKAEIMDDLARIQLELAETKVVLEALQRKEAESSSNRFMNFFQLGVQ